MYARNIPCKFHPLVSEKLLLMDELMTVGDSNLVVTNALNICSGELNFINFKAAHPTFRKWMFKYCKKHSSHWIYLMLHWCMFTYKNDICLFQILIRYWSDRIIINQVPHTIQTKCKGKSLKLIKVLEQKIIIYVTL